MERESRRRDKKRARNTSEPLKGRKRRNARGDGRGILLEIQRDVNILLYIEPARQSEKVFSGEARAASFSSALSEISPSFIGARLTAGGKKGGQKTPGDSDAVINVIMKRD
jgi:hypothetical protein